MESRRIFYQVTHLTTRWSGTLALLSAEALAGPTRGDEMRSILAVPSRQRRDEFLTAVARSRELHRHWASPPRTVEAFEAYLKRIKKPAYVGYWVRTDANELVGVININEIVRGTFLSGYLGYYAFVPHNGRGYMTAGLRTVVSQAFRELRLHRLEANIQPDNEPSRRLVQRLGFRYEGFSPRYLKVGGRWRDHERWALTAEEWLSRTNVAGEYAVPPDRGPVGVLSERVRVRSGHGA